MYLVHSNHCNVIVGVFVFSVYFILRLTAPFSLYLFISYAISRGALLQFTVEHKGSEEPRLGNTAVCI